MPRENKAKECVVMSVGANFTYLEIEARVDSTAAAKAWLRDNGQEGKTYRIGFLRPEGYTIDRPEPKRKLTEWSE